MFAPLAHDVDEERFDALLRELAERVDNERVRGELGATMRVIAERNSRVPGLGERITAILGEEVIMQSEFLRTMRDKTRAETRREEIMRFATELLDEGSLEQLRELEDLEELERTTLALIKQRQRNHDDDA